MTLLTLYNMCDMLIVMLTPGVHVAAVPMINKYRDWGQAKVLIV